MNNKKRSHAKDESKKNKDLIKELPKSMIRQRKIYEF